VASFVLKEWTTPKHTIKATWTRELIHVKTIGFVNEELIGREVNINGRFMLKFTLSTILIVISIFSVVNDLYIE